MEADACFSREGIWFDAGELEAVIKADSSDFDFIDVGREELDGEEFKQLKEELDEKMGNVPVVRRAPNYQSEHTEGVIKSRLIFVRRGTDYGLMPGK